MRERRCSNPHWARLPCRSGAGAGLVCKYRLADGRQIQRKIGPAWADRGRPPKGYFTKRTAEAWLQDVLAQARRGTLPGMVRSGATFAEAADEWMRYIEQDRGRKPSTVRDYKSVLNAQLLPVFGTMLIESITPDGIEQWRGPRSTGCRIGGRTSC